ncbi:hypothetical protein Taro_054194 [Colocasia esculenta]|uniref:Uncharacterized protein n=1 Tax=Colocasia esculenta TaxID=4460 RepID=A0A843XPV4_COLES|nr:hypothetical protein [Colocasia esculenta]
MSRKIHVFKLQTKCVDTQADCVDTTGHWLQNRFWEGQRSVSTHRQTMSTPLATGFRTGSGRDSECRHTGRLCRHHWQTVSTHRQTVSTPL